MRLKKWLCGALTGVSLFTASVVSFAAERVSWEAPPTLTLVAECDYQWGGIAVSPSGRIFVCFPSWGNHPSYHVGELLNGTVYPYYDLEDHASFGCVQSVYSDGSETLWVLDTGTKPTGNAAPSDAKLLIVDLSRNEISRTYMIPSEALLPDSVLNDVRVDNARGVAYITDSGHGGVIVLELTTGDAWRALTDIPEVRANIQSIYFPSGLYTNLAHTDGLELDSEKKRLFFSSLGSDILYAVPTAALLDRSLTVADRQKQIKAINVQNVPTDGMVLRNGMLYMGALSNEGVWEFELDKTDVAEAGAILNLGKDIRWASSFALAPNDSVYFITSANNYPPDQQKPYEMYRMTWPKKRDGQQYDSN